LSSVYYKRHSGNGSDMEDMSEEPEKPINLLWSVDEVMIALQRIRERLRRMAQQDGPPPKPPKTGKA